MTVKENICPRCRGLVPNAAVPGKYPGAGSRLTRDRSIEICSACGVDEAMGRGLVPQEYWPILTRTSIPDNADRHVGDTVNETTPQQLAWLRNHPSAQ